MSDDWLFDEINPDDVKISDFLRNESRKITSFFYSGVDFSKFGVERYLPHYVILNVEKNVLQEDIEERKQYIADVLFGIWYMKFFSVGFYQKPPSILPSDGNYCVFYFEELEDAIMYKLRWE